jgi:hypothetical protein
VEGRAFGEGKRSYIYVSPIYLFKCLASFLSVSAAYDADFPASELFAFWFLLFSFAKLSLVIWIRVVCVSVLVFFSFCYLRDSDRSHWCEMCELLKIWV